jgi:hypothetical protein
MQCLLKIEQLPLNFFREVLKRLYEVTFVGIRPTDYRLGVFKMLVVMKQIYPTSEMTNDFPGLGSRSQCRHDEKRTYWLA